MKVLYISQSKELGGSSKSLLLMVEEIKTKHKEFKPVFFVSKGEFQNLLIKRGFNAYSTKWISMFDNTRYGHYRGIRWLILIREITHLPLTLFKLYSIIKNEKFDIIHLNDAPLFIYAFFIKKICKAKIVLHIRSVQNTKENLRKKVFAHICNIYVDKIICIDKRVKESINYINNDKVEVIYNGFKKPENTSMLNFNKKRENFIVGFVGFLYKAKGIYELLEAIRYLVLEKGYKDLKLYIAGKNTRDINNKFIKYILKFAGFYNDALSDIEMFINNHHLEDNIKYLGFLNEEELAKFYQEIDVLCFPSRLDAIGRPVFEAAFYGKPSIAAISRDYNEIIINNVSGIIIEKPEIDKIVKSIEYLYQNRDLTFKMGKEAQNIAMKYFDIEINAQQIFRIYQSLINTNLHQL
ncbi:MAG: glycosyltransferase family 4 protein [Sulfurihydrogenibium sp.]|jgi:glycosyltransferase involved in cell wall biosynthesis|nr:glycosyltransferase family 4 protein [Sulfurihydrogenibium sp.]